MDIDISLKPTTAMSQLTIQFNIYVAYVCGNVTLNPSHV